MLLQVNLSSGKVAVVVKGADFFSSPRVSRDGKQLAWLEWNHPDMPWDDTRLMVAQLNSDGYTEGIARLLVGGDPQRQLSVLYPTWTADGGLLYAADHEDFWDLHHVDNDGANRRLIFSRGSRDLIEPPWVFNLSCFNYQSEADSVVLNSVGDGIIEISLKGELWVIAYEMNYNLFAD